MVSITFEQNYWALQTMFKSRVLHKARDEDASIVANWEPVDLLERSSLYEILA